MTNRMRGVTHGRTRSLSPPPSFLASCPRSPEADSRLTTEPYTRSWDDDEHLGLHDMAVRPYCGMLFLHPSFPSSFSCSCFNFFRHS
jgi:hypothetical protein